MKRFIRTATQPCVGIPFHTCGHPLMCIHGTTQTRHTLLQKPSFRARLAALGRSQTRQLLARTPMVHSSLVSVMHGIGWLIPSKAPQPPASVLLDESCPIYRHTETNDNNSARSFLRTS